MNEEEFLDKSEDGPRERRKGYRDGKVVFKGHRAKMSAASMSDSTCLKNDQGQWRIGAFNHVDHVALEDLGLAKGA
jgi:hypothetical protein